MTTAPDPQEDRTDAYTGGQSIESRLAAEFADIAVLSGAAPVIVVEFPMSDSPGGVIVAAPDRALQRFDHEPYASASERVPLPAPGELITHTGAALDRLRADFEMLSPQLRTAVTARLDVDGNLIGAAILAFEEPRRPGPRARRVLLAAARQLARALHQERLERSLRDQAEESRTLLDLAQLSTSTLQLDEMLDRFLERAVELTSADKGNIWLLSDDGSELIPTALTGMPDAFVSEWKTQRFALSEQPLSAEALSTQQPIAIPDAAADPRTDKLALDLFGERALLVVPVRSAGEALGTLFLNNVSRRERHTAREVEIAQSIASQAGASIRLARLFEASERGRRDLEAAFRRFGQVLAASADPVASLETLAELAAQMVAADSGIVYLTRGESLELVATAGLEPDAASPAASPGTLVARCVSEGRALHLDSVSPTDIGLRSPGGSPAAFACAATPLAVGESTVGALAVARSSRAFTADEIDLLAAFGRGAAGAVQRGELLDALERRVSELSQLQKLSQSIATLSTIEETVENVVRGAASLVQADRCVVFLANAAGALEPQMPAIGFSPEELTALASDAHEDLGLQVLTSGEHLMWNEVVDGGEAEGRIRMERDLLIVPMRAGDERIGVIRVSGKAAAFTEDDARLLSIFAGQAAGVVRNVMLYQTEARGREQLEAIFVNATDGIVIADPDARILRMNAAAEAMTGWDRQSSIGRAVGEVLPLRGVHDQPLDTTHPLRWVQLQRTTIAYREQVMERRDGQTVEVAASYAHVPGPAGQGPLAVAILRDLSAAKQIERMKSDFVSFVSHELRTPLSLIRGYASTLMRPDLSLEHDTRERFIQGISDAADRLRLIVDNLLNASRIESGRFVPRLRVVDLRTVVEPVVEEMQAGAVGRLFLIWEAGEAPVSIDADQIRVVLSNLIGNAVRYAVPHSDGPVVIAVRAADDGLTVEVADNGPGVAEDDLPHIFEKFYRGADDSRASLSGTGLGLHISRSLVEAHGGRVWLNSTPGEGAIAGFWLPRAGDGLADVDPEVVAAPA